MHALIVVESLFGNTRAVADAVAEGLSPVMSADVVDVLDAPTTIESTVDLLVVGGPTHALGMSRPNTRKDGARQAGRPEEVARIGVREWLQKVSPVRVKAAAFDTRTDKRWVPGAASRGIAKGLRKLGTTLIADPESFTVTDVPGPLTAGELDRARRWGERLAATPAVVDRGGRRS